MADYLDQGIKGHYRKWKAGSKVAQAIFAYTHPGEALLGNLIDHIHDISLQGTLCIICHAVVCNKKTMQFLICRPNFPNRKHALGYTYTVDLLFITCLNDKSKVHSTTQIDLIHSL